MALYATENQNCASDSALVIDYMCYKYKY